MTVTYRNGYTLLCQDGESIFEQKGFWLLEEMEEKHAKEEAA